MSWLFVACAGNLAPAGAVCSATADCDQGLMCLDLGQFMGSQCFSAGRACSITCTDDTACAKLGSDFKCFATCSTDKVCGKVGP